MDARLATGGWLALTRQGLSPCKRRQAFLGARTLGVRRGEQRERGTSGRWQLSPARRGSAGLRLRGPPQAPVHLHAASGTPALRLASGPPQADSHWRPAEILLASRSRVIGRGGVENRQCAPALLGVLGRYESWPHLHNATARLVARDLPVRDELLKCFEDEHRRAYPEHTGTKGFCRAWVVEQLLALFVTGIDIKIIAHHQDDINIIRVGLRGDIAAKEDQAFQLAHGTSETVDTPQA